MRAKRTGSYLKSKQTDIEPCALAFGSPEKDLQIKMVLPEIVTNWDGPVQPVVAYIKHVMLP
jgi:hypothetical protein